MSPSDQTDLATGLWAAGNDEGDSNSPSTRTPDASLIETPMVHHTAGLSIQNLVLKFLCK